MSAAGLPLVPHVPAPTARRGMSRTGSRAVKLLVVAAMLLLLVACAYTSVLIAQRQAALQRGTGYNVTWLLTQAGLEMARLRIAVIAAMLPATAVDEAEVELRLDILDSRVGLMALGEVHEFNAARPDLRPLVDQFIAVAAEVRTVFEAGAPDRYQRMDALLAPLHEPLSRLAAAGHGYSGIKTLAEQAALSRLYWTLAGLLCAVSLCGIGLVGILGWQNRLLSQAKNRVRRQNRALLARDRELNLRNARFDAALTNMSQALCMVDGEQRVIVCNTRFLAMFGLPAAAAEPGVPVADVFRAAAMAGRYRNGLVEALFAWQARHAATHTAGCVVETDDEAALAMSQQPMDRGGWVATIEDITERRRAEARIGFLANHDVLTGLPNRRLFQARLQDALDRSVHPEDTVAVLCLNLDRFKQVNDTLGHAAGDCLLKSVAARLQACAGGGLVARLSGDEFAILQTAVPQPNEAEALARRVVDAIARPHAVEGHQVPAGASIGVAVLQPGRDDADTLMRRADIALNRAKADGRGRFRTFDEAMDAETQARRAMAADLREALAKGEFEVFYQPLFDLAANKVCAFEALLRWRHPARGTVVPATFVPLAEELGLINPIGEWVLAQACRDAAAWPDDVKVAVNLSATQVRGTGLLGAVQRALDAAGVPASRLELEITESVLLHDSDAVLATLSQLNDLGVCIALDDFGTGYSSLSYLRSFPFGKLKIDRGFIEGVAVRDDCEAIVRSITSLAHMLGMATTAEGVETPEQLQCLRAIGCCEVQGYLLDIPRPVAEIGRWFAGRTMPMPMPNFSQPVPRVSVQ